jgi:phospholipid/cholesterol/gamma-HCH transport system ATP-binding protein
METDETVIRVRDLAVSYDGRKVLDQISFDVAAGEILVIMGRSGCGKTTLLKAMIGLIEPDAGTVDVLGQTITSLDEDALDEFRESIGMLFQFGALINSTTVGENILLPLRRRCRLDEKTARSVAQLKLAMVGLPDVFDLYPAQLSGGMKKRAGFARALMLDPAILFFDEPTSGLDPNTAADMDELILSLREILGTTMVVVTHDLASAFAVADRMIMMHEGRMVAEGTADALRQSAHPSVQAFVERRPSTEDVPTAQSIEAPNS